MGSPTRFNKEINICLVNNFQDKGENINKILLNSCRLKVSHETTKQVQNRPTITTNLVRLPFCSAEKSHNTRKCAFCNSKTTLRVIPSETGIDPFVLLGLLVSVGSKSCPK